MIEQGNCSGDFAGCAGSLDRARNQDDLQRRIAPLHDVQDIANRSACRGSDKADAVRKRRDGSLALLGKKALGGEFLFEFFKRSLERANALRFDGQDVELVWAAGFIDGQFAFENHLAAILQRLPAGDRIIAKNNATDLRKGVLEREINMAGVLRAAIGNLAADPKLGKMLFEQSPDVGRQFTD